MSGVLSGSEDEFFRPRPSRCGGGTQIAAIAPSDPRQDWRLTLVLVRGNTNQTGRTPVRNYGDGA